ncbi:hypothetical protein K431DRAFT_288708 [Polychaeton citri CBS 116435]|uniref:Uncharacterized protein n=1 Tax=Polychaeton citri CBS 116435 TaxID=1314669 RepID=A0A9P4Q360_9PEZI|nr:hypothetical protein K431DRAFT_288708 [Polychaeton citri CBS 116435]
MAQANVSSSVLSIVASFTSGLDIFKRLRERRRRRKRTKASDKIDEDELRLSKSLRQGPEDIGREYQRSTYRVGEQFGIGDSIAQTLLAEILLKLNTGLLTIIASFLDRGKSSIQLDYRALTGLSERSRDDTISVLQQLYQRMKQARTLADVPETHSKVKAQKSAKHDEAKKRIRPVAKKHTKVQGPQLARVIIQDSSRPSQLAMVRGGAKKKPHQRSASASSSPSTTDVSTPPTTPPTPDLPAQAHAKPRETVDPPSSRPRDQPTMMKSSSRPPQSRSATAPEIPRLRKKQSAANVEPLPRPYKPEPLRATRSTPKLRAPAPPPVSEVPDIPELPAAAITSKGPGLHVRPAALEIDARRQRTTPTYYSTATASTKLGEIPLHKWAVPYDFDQASILNKEAERNGWPLNEVAEEPSEGRRRRFGLFRLFRRRGEEA